MEKKDDNEVNNQTKNNQIKSMKMQDFFGITKSNSITDGNEIKKITQNVINRESDKNVDSNKKNNLYDFLYESGTLVEENISNNDKRPKTEPQKNIEPSQNNINIEGGLCIVERSNLYIDDSHYVFSEFIIQNYVCKFNFDEKVQSKFVNLVHFTPKYFEFPIFYAYKGKYDEETHTTTINLKDYRSFRISTENNKIYKKLFEAFNNKVDYYRYAQFYRDIQDKKNIKYKKDGWYIYDPIKEYLRQGIEISDNKFSFSELNKKYELCETYPSLLVVPKKFDNKELFQIAKSRMKNRFPVLSYHYNNPNKKIKSYMYRSAQINKGGIIFKSKNLEVEYMNAITDIENNKKGFIIFDCRPELNAKANALKGAGIEDISNYKNCKKLLFGDIENIHNVRKSFKSALQKAYYGKENVVEGKISIDIKNYNTTNFLSKFESTKWLKYISDLLIGSITVAKYLIKNYNVLVHCSDGWDRTAQVCSLVEIILDPYYRTIEGFAVLVEKEWVSFGHKFASRNGCETNPEKQKDRSPLFIQFIHAVHQIVMQYPTAFEFNNYFLLFLCKEIYSNKYGTFLFNNEKEKINYKATETMISIWSDVLNNKYKYINDLYKPMNATINIKGELKYLNIWNDYFFKFDKVGMAYRHKALLDKEEYISKIQEDKNKSIIELLKVIKDNGLENLIQKNKIYKLYKDKLNKNE